MTAALRNERLTDPVGPPSVPSAFEPRLVSVLAPADAADVAARLAPRAWIPFEQRVADRAHRRVEVLELPSTEFGPFTDHLRDVMLALNDRHYRFALAGHRRSDAPHAVRYTPRCGHYDWHSDAGPEWPTRKLSLVLFLTEPSDYEGGILEIAGAEVAAEPSIGSGVVFPSFVGHRVTPVTAGCRITVVAWMHGPTFS